MSSTSREEGAGEAFTKHQKAIDEAINERTKEDRGPSADPNNPRNRDRQSDTAHKKTGGGKQKNPGM
ncbi:hypothetical protein [Dawidia soli]|uniref:Uncharacterized protein n=1 Tax=Dawidia soli TaxID=2782352 RepID=A0AAP2D424_9BACT|nr:hypothetical protein [Dawidia soli]MBT1684943.1 hypothetical protein [Dawidia soli]